MKSYLITIGLAIVAVALVFRTPLRKYVVGA